MTLKSQINFNQDTHYRPVLDHGFVGLVDHMGSDQSIVRAARVSYGVGTKNINDDRHLIRYLMRHDHTTPFEMCELVFHIKLPIFVMRQLVRHRTASMNEYSARYSVITDEFYVPDVKDIKPQNKDNKQGRGGELTRIEAEHVQSDMRDTWKLCFDTYNMHLDQFGLARETARAILPVGGYTECYWKSDLKNFLNMIRLRNDDHAQWEIQEYARAMYELSGPLFPLAIEAFEHYQMKAVKFSSLEMIVLKDYLKHSSKGWLAWIDQLGGELNVREKYALSQRELKELSLKLQ